MIKIQNIFLIIQFGTGNKIASSGITQPPIIVSILKQILDNHKISKIQEKNNNYN